MKQNLDTTRYANGIVARNSKTGLYWDGSAFLGDSNGKAALLDAGQLAVLRHTYENVIDERVVTLVDEICAACNATGKVGYFFNASRGRTLLDCELMVSVSPKRVVSCSWRECDGNIEMHLRNPDDGGRLAYRVVSDLAKIPVVLDEWKQNSSNPLRWTVEKNNCQWSPGEYRVLGRVNSAAQVIIAQGSEAEMTVIAEALNASGLVPK